jgi:hypothetical protein
MDVDVETNKAWLSVREDTKASATQSLGYYEFKHHRPWKNEESSKLLAERKQAKMP